MNDHILVAFRNDKALMREEIISEREFPVTNIFYDKKHTYTVVELNNKSEFLRYIKALAEFIIDKYESKILKRIINKNYPEIPNVSVCEIIRLKDEDDKKERKRVVEKILEGYFLENDSGNVEGIVNFRLREYKKILNKMAERLVDIYYLNREYDDFIELLRYFISVQSTRCELVYIVVNDGAMYTVLDEEKNDITKKVLLELVPPEEIENVAFDDLLISMMISIAPKKIIIKNKEKIKNQQLFETLEKVFEKVEYK